MITRRQIAGTTYLRISDVAKVAHVNIRTLQRWINHGDLVNFLTVYQSKSRINYFRLGPPRKDDVLIPGSGFRYYLPDELENETDGDSNEKN